MKVQPNGVTFSSLVSVSFLAKFFKSKALELIDSAPLFSELSLAGWALLALY